MKIDGDSFVTLDYLIRVGQEETYPPGGQSEQVSFLMGRGVMPPGLEEAIIGLQVNDHRVLRLSPAQAYGEIDHDLIMEVPREEFPAELELHPGLVFETEDEEGRPAYFMIQEVRPDLVVIDFNHPLAGKELEVSFTVRQVREATPQDLEQCPSCSEGETGGTHRH